MEYIFEINGKYYNTFTKEPASDLGEKPVPILVKEGDITYNRKKFVPIFKYTADLERIERKYGVKYFRNIVTECYEYDVEACGSTVYLTVYKGTFDPEAGMKWAPVYVAAATPGMPLHEEGENDLSYWYDRFRSSLGSDIPSTANIHNFEHRPHTMKRVREVYPCELCENAFTFFVKISKNPEYKVISYPPEMFRRAPYLKTRKAIGKEYDSKKHKGEIIHYAWQRETVLEGIVFLDVVVISGFVTDGVMDIESSHRFFLAEDFVYSPDGGDFGVFAEKNFFGKVVTNKFRKQENKLMLERYTGPNVYKYMFSKYFVPAFEIIAKAGFSTLADVVLEKYYEEYYRLKAYDWTVNYLGANDKEILGFKMKYLHILPDEVVEKYSFSEGVKKFFVNIRQIAKANPSIFYIIKDTNTFGFVSWHTDFTNIFDRVRYIESIGTEKYTHYIGYLLMCRQAGRYAEGYGQFPKDLDTAHDAMTVYLRAMREAASDEDFVRTVSQEDYLKYVFIPEGGNYCILAPRTADDLIQESYKLSHCVRSYVGAVARGLTRIYFLRKQNSKSTPLVTVEVKDGFIEQARGRFNRDLTYAERQFLLKWASANGLRTKAPVII